MILHSSLHECCRLAGNKKFELMLTRRAKTYSMPMLICNRFHERLANIGKIATFAGVPLFHALLCRFLWT